MVLKMVSLKTYLSTIVEDPKNVNRIPLLLAIETGGMAGSWKRLFCYTRTLLDILLV